MKRLLAIFISAFISLFVFVPNIMADEVPSDMNSFEECLKASTDYSLCQLKYAELGAGAAAISASLGVAIDPDTGQPIAQHSLIGDTTKLMAFTVTQPPANTSTYVADVLDNFGAKPAYAQGVGFSALQPVLKVWKAFRNLVYFLFVIVFVVIGFMIMFRAKINPQTVVSAQQALPQIVITLILVTFSYAIAGFVVDLVYFSIYLITGLLEIGGLLNDGRAAANALLGKTILGIGWNYLLSPNNAAGSVADALNDIVTDIFSGIEIEGAPVIGGLTSVLGYLIAALAITINLIRALFTLLKAYIGIILSVIFAPFQIMMNAFPGSDAFMGWLRGLIANAAVFPVAALMILLGIILMGDDTQGPFEDGALNAAPGVGFTSDKGGNPGGFVPPLVLPGNVGTAGALQAIIGFGIIMLLPEVLDIVRKALKTEDKYGELAQKNWSLGYSRAFGLGKRGVGAWMQTQKEAEAIEAEWARASRLSQAMGGAPIATPSVSRTQRRLRYIRNLFGL